MDDCSKEAVRIAADTSIPALYVTRLLDQLGIERGLPKVIRTDNGPEFAGRTMHDWAARNGVELRFIQPGKPVQNAYIESFNSRFRDECLSQLRISAHRGRSFQAIVDGVSEERGRCFRLIVDDVSA